MHIFIFIFNLVITFDSDPSEESQTTNIDEPTIPFPTLDAPSSITQDLPSSSMIDRVVPPGRGSASAEELKAFSPGIDNLLLDTPEPSYMRKASALIA